MERAMGLWGEEGGKPKWNVMRYEGEVTRCATAKHVRHSWTKREVTSHHNHKKRYIKQVE